AGVAELDAVAYTHPHADHVGGMQAVLQNFDVQTLLTPDLSETDVTGQTQRALQTAQECGVPVETAYTGQQYTIGTGTLTV
ncbi:MAG TPA: MBL fold metallo-hydrolase, partial [Gemmiger qucibialis]|nr:MBL fold metallo-hydrolase [Gemmiger qucibialis]